MREIITLGVGNFGNNVTAALYQQLSQEHGILPDGRSVSPGIAHQFGFPHVHFSPINSSRSSSFQQTQYSARAILLDCDPDSIDRVRASTFGSIYRLDNLHQTKQHTGGCWGAGMYTTGTPLVDAALESLRKEFQGLDLSPEGFIFNSAIQGGTGGGVFSRLIQQVTESYPHIPNVSNVLLSHKTCPSSTVSVYNQVFSLHRLIENSTMVNMLDNLAITQKLRRRKGTILGDLSEINAQISYFVSQVTAPCRFCTTQGTSLRKIAVNLIPFPRLHFFGVNSMRPSSSRVFSSASKLLEPTFKHSELMCSYKIADAQTLTGYVSFSGDIPTSEVQEAVFQINNPIHLPYIEWIPGNFHTSVAKAPWQGGAVILNSMANTQMFRRLSYDFTNLFRRKAFTKWFLNEGMDEMEFIEAESNLNDLISDYMPQSAGYVQDQDYEQYEQEAQSS